MEIAVHCGPEQPRIAKYWATLSSIRFFARTAHSRVIRCWDIRLFWTLVQQKFEAAAPSVLKMKRSSVALRSKEATATSIFCHR